MSGWLAEMDRHCRQLAMRDLRGKVVRLQWGQGSRLALVTRHTNNYHRANIYRLWNERLRQWSKNEYGLPHKIIGVIEDDKRPDRRA